jgi:hypothetical protein
MNYMIRHGRRIEIETIDTGAPAKTNRPAKGEPFAKMPLRWAKRAAEATGSPAVLVCARLVHLAWEAKGKSFTMANKWLEERGVSRKVKYRMLRNLEAAGLIMVERQPRKSPRITLVSPYAELVVSALTATNLIPGPPVLGQPPLAQTVPQRAMYCPPAGHALSPNGPCSGPKLGPYVPFLTFLSSLK